MCLIAAQLSQSKTLITTEGWFDGRDPNTLPPGDRQVRMRPNTCNRDALSKIVLIDGKLGDGLRHVDGLRGQVGPLAITQEQARSALQWAMDQMDARYRMRREQSFDGKFPPIFVMIDELQEFTVEMADKAIIKMVRRIGALGRAVSAYLIVGTQHPAVDVFGDKSTKRHFTTRLALHVTDYAASHAILDTNTPRADETLLGQGDAYIKTPTSIHRLQLAYIPKQTLKDHYLGHLPQMSAWPDFQSFRSSKTSPGRKPEPFTGEEFAEAILAASEGVGRDSLRKRLRERVGSRMGSTRAARLLEEARVASDYLREKGFCSHVSAADPTRPN
jgi:DNA segregation ATPase FtsK/SpoIIIE-like protein